MAVTCDKKGTCEEYFRRGSCACAKCEANKPENPPYDEEFDEEAEEEVKAEKAEEDRGYYKAVDPETHKCPKCGSKDLLSDDYDDVECQSCKFEADISSFELPTELSSEDYGCPECGVRSGLMQNSDGDVKCSACGYEGPEFDFELPEDDFGNKGKEIYSVKVKFTQKRSGEAEVEVAADSEDQAKARVKEILEEDEYSILEDVEFDVDNQESEIVDVDVT